MTIEWRPDDRQFHLQNSLVSLVLRVYEDGSLGQLHFGAPLPTGRSYRHLGPDPFEGFQNRVGDPIPFAVPTPGTGDFRGPAIVAAGADGATTLALRYRDHRILPGKPSLEGLPSTYVEDDAEAETLEIALLDGPTGLVIETSWTLFAGRPVVARSAVIRNGGDAPIELRTAMSLSLDLPDADWTMVTLAGAWARETHVVEQPLVVGRRSISSTRGSSSAQHNPFLVLRRSTTDEEHGEAIGFGLVYSSNFLADAEVDSVGTTRIRLGIEPETFAWHLAPGESFTTPEAIVVHVTEGLGALSEAFHDMYRDRLARGPWRDRPRPVLINSWEATYFDFDADRLVAIARSARDLGIELFVLDDGWYGRRDSDTTSLGDWVVDRRKLPDGLEGVARRINDLGMGFGLWIEPEMISPDSDLYRAHPEWAIGVPGRARTESRNQLVLDLGREDVVDHIEAAIAAILESAPIAYIKWDMNRSLTEPYGTTLPPGRQGEAVHRHILGVYELYRRLTTRFPQVLFESCASGGARFDPGMLAYAPQGWTSDGTDAVERLRIQWGTSMCYPLSAIAAHVSAVPNHQVGRVTPLATRAAVAFFGVFGYELDPLAMSDAERATVAAQVDFYTRHRVLLQRGRFLRLESPFDGDRDRVAWMVSDARADHAIVGVYRILNRPTPEVHRVRLRGLEPAAVYRVEPWPASDDDPMAAANTGERTGAELMAAGLTLDMERHEAARLGDFWARIFVLDRVD